MSAAAFSSAPLRRPVARSPGAPLRRPRALPPRLPRCCAAYSSADWDPAEPATLSGDTARQQAAAAYGDAAGSSASAKDFFATEESAAGASAPEQLFGAESSSGSAQQSSAPTAAELFSSSYFGAPESSASASRAPAPPRTDAERERLASDTEALYAGLFAEPAGSYPRASAWAARPVRPEVVRKASHRSTGGGGGASSSLTPAEIESFRDILNIPNRHGDEADLHADASYGSLDEERQAAAAGFGGSLRRDGPGALEAFYERNALRAPVASPQHGNTRGGYLVPSGWRGRQGIVQDAETKKRPPPIGALREGVSVERVGPAEMERTLEEARAEVAACESVADVWQWAAEHVLRSPEGEESFGEVTGDAAHASSSAPARYGSTTAFYAPVLLMLLRDLRERFHSPLSALAVLEAASLRGVVSLVQLTPMLYSEAIHTRHAVLGDLAGAYASLQAARATGVVPAPSAARKIVVPRFSDSEAAQRKDEETLRRAVEEVTNAVREASVTRRPRALDSRSSFSSSSSSAGAADVRFRSEKARQDVRIADAMSALAGYSRATSIVMEEGVARPGRNRREVQVHSVKKGH